MTDHTSRPAEPSMCTGASGPAWEHPSDQRATTTRDPPIRRPLPIASQSVAGRRKWVAEGTSLGIWRPLAQQVLDSGQRFFFRSSEQKQHPAQPSVVGRRGPSQSFVVGLGFRRLGPQLGVSKTIEAGAPTRPAVMPAGARQLFEARGRNPPRSSN